MTAIAGLVHDGKVYIGGDSAGVAGMDLHLRSDPKVFTVGEFVIGYTTSFRMGRGDGIAILIQGAFLLALDATYARKLSA